MQDTILQMVAVALTHIMAGDEFLYHPVDVGNYEVFR